MTLEELQAKRNRILDSIGTLRVQLSDGRAVEYVQDKQRELAMIDVEIAKLQSPQPRQFTIQTSRGL